MCIKLYAKLRIIISKIITFFTVKQKSTIYDNDDFIAGLDFSDYILYDCDNSTSRTCFIWGCSGRAPLYHVTNNCPNNCTVVGCSGGHITAMHDNVITDIKELFI